MSAHPAAGEPDLMQLDHQLCFALYSSAHALNRAYKPVLKALDLTYPQYLAMIVLWERDGVTVKEIGDRLHLDSGTLTPLLKRLEAMGLVTRTRDAADERQVRIQLTDKGRALRDTARAVPKAILRAMGQPMDELNALKGALVRLRDRLNQASDAAA
jgi:DNA-binding MarR family transcriptional regulator